MALKLGRKKRGFDLSIPHYHALRTMMAQSYTFPDLHTTLDNAAHLPENLGMMLNDQLGDCTCAGMGHATQLVSFDAGGKMITPPDSDILHAYEAFGYRPGDPSTDGGAQMQDVLAWWKNTGLQVPGGRHKILSYVEVDPRNIRDVCEAIQEGGYADIGIEIPGGLMEDVENNGVTVFDDNPNYSGIEGGHCVILTGFDFSQNMNAPVFNVISWGSRQYTMTTAFLQTYAEEVYMTIDPMWIAKSGKSPMGLTEAQIEQLAQYV